VDAIAWATRPDAKKIIECRGDHLDQVLATSFDSGINLIVSKIGPSVGTEELSQLRLTHKQRRSLDAAVIGDCDEDECLGIGSFDFR
jgi:hypothetical protein